MPTIWQSLPQLSVRFHQQGINSSEELTWRAITAGADGVSERESNDRQQI
jgi:hypothetical protein